MSRKKKYPVRIPRFAAGIRSQETRGGKRSWWAMRWMRILEQMRLGSRLGRAKNYAISGQIAAMRIAGPVVEAEVVGTRRDPYLVKMEFRVPDEKVRRRIIAAIRAEPMLVARLLVDDFPTEIEEFFRNEGLDLFPGGKIAPGRYDMTLSCTCPDYANPCKHSAAALLILGEEIARRPATLLELRGITMEELYDED
jgi:uncharacterized Zn finger protein